MKLGDKELSVYVSGKLALPGDERNEHRQQVGRLLDKLDAVLAADGSYKIKKFRRAGSLEKGTSNRPRAGRQLAEMYASVASQVGREGAFFGPDERHYSMVAKITIQDRKVKRVGYLPVLLNDRMQPRIMPVDDPGGRVVVDYVESITREIGLDTRFERFDLDEIVVSPSTGWSVDSIGSQPLRVRCYSRHSRWGSASLPSKRSAWSPTADHYPRLKMHGGQLTPDNVRLAHRLCKQRDYIWRKRSNAMLGKRKPDSRAHRTAVEYEKTDWTRRAFLCDRERLVL